MSSTQPMDQLIAGIELPDSVAAIDATALARERLSPLLFDHSRRVFLFGALRARDLGLSVDPELLYLASLFHDGALASPYADPTQRFEVDGADHARAFMLERGFPSAAADVVWTAIALHTTPGVPVRMGPEIAATAYGVLVDTVGLGLDTLDPAQVDEITTVHPRGDFKREFVRTFVDGLRDRADTTYGTVYADVPEHSVPGFRRSGMIERIEGSGWPT
ncbi:MAG TPA: HD domain-containing protein [Nocardioides sp.]|nr:HD domain-containing protein [Nocardioides sp.]